MRFDFRNIHAKGGSELIRLFAGNASRTHAGNQPKGAGGPQRNLRPRHPSMRLLDAVMVLAGPHAELISHAERSWASATFSGMRHSFTLSFTGEDAVRAADEFIATLPDHEFTIPGQLVADAGVNEVTHMTTPRPIMVIEADVLLLDEG